MNDFKTEAVQRYAEHERRYHEFAGGVERREWGDLLVNSALPLYRDANHAALLRTVGVSADEIAGEVVSFYGGRGLRAGADVDAAAEAQGIGAALRRRGLMPLVETMRPMRFPFGEPPSVLAEEVRIEGVALETGAEEAREWVELQVSDESSPEAEAFWRGVAEAEARFPLCYLFLARIGDTAAGACSLFSAEGWGRVDSVVTHPDFRRRGVASSLVSAAIAKSLSEGNTETYLTTERGGAGEAVYRKLGFVEWAIPIPRRHLEARG